MRAAIVAEARTWIGTRWQHQACLKGVGCDCIGLIAGVARELGMPEASAYLASQFRNYGRLPDPKMLRRACAEFLDEKTTPAEPGDILLMSFVEDPQHFAIAAGPTIIHAYAQRRRVCEHSLDDTWRARVVGVYAYRGIA